MGVTVVMPLYNKANFVVESIRSVNQQVTLPEEIIVVDDGSTDRGAELVERTFSNVTVLRQRNQGPGPARNQGLQAARSSWVAFLDADDRWLPHHLSEITHLIGQFPNARLVATEHVEVPACGRTLAIKPDNTIRNEIDYFVEAGRRIGIICSSSAAVHTQTALEIGGFGDDRLGEDLEFWARIALQHPVAHSSALTALYVRGIGGLIESSEARRGDVPNLGPSDLASVSPAARTIVAALATRDFAVPEHHLRAYLDGRVSSGMMQRLARGDVEGARSMRRLLAHPYRSPARLATVLTKVPAPLFRSALRTRNRVRSKRRRPA